MAEIQDTRQRGVFALVKDFIYLFMSQREAETQTKGEAGSSQGARCGTRSRESETMS